MAAVGDLVYYNEGNDQAPAWAVAQVVMTDTVPSADAVAAILDQYGIYPSTPQPGQVMLVYTGLVGNDIAQQASAWSSEGTGPGQYTTTLPAW